MQVELDKLKVGDTVYYRDEDYDGNVTIVKRKIRKIYVAPLPIEPKDGKRYMCTFYEIADGFGCQRNCIFTLNDLFTLSNYALDSMYNKNVRRKSKMKIPEELLEKIKEKTQWFEKEYASIYGELCSCAGAGAKRLPVITIYDLTNILEEYFKSQEEEK